MEAGSPGIHLWLADTPESPPELAWSCGDSGAQWGSVTLEWTPGRWIQRRPFPTWHNRAGIAVLLVCAAVFDLFPHHVHMWTPLLSTHYLSHLFRTRATNLRQALLNKEKWCSHITTTS